MRVSSISCVRHSCSALAIFAMLFCADSSANPRACPKWNTLEFFRAATADGVQRCLNEGADANAKDRYGDTPLHRAGMVGDPAVVHALVSAGADVNARNNSGETPLHKAGSAAAVMILVNAGADPNAADRGGWAPLDVAKEAEVIEELTDSGAKFSPTLIGECLSTQENGKQCE